MRDFYHAAYNPDVLSCLADLSNDEVFTPPEVAVAAMGWEPTPMNLSTRPVRRKFLR